MMEDIANVGSALKRCLTIWVAAISLLNIEPAIIYAQVAKPPSAARAPAPSKFHLEEARIEDIHRAIKSRQITCEQVVKAYMDRAFTAFVLSRYDRQWLNWCHIYSVQTNIFVLVMLLSLVE